MSSPGIFKIMGVTDIRGNPKKDEVHKSLIGARTRLYGSPRCGYGLTITKPDGQTVRTTTIHTVINRYGNHYIVKTINSNYYLEPDDDEENMRESDRES